MNKDSLKKFRLKIEGLDLEILRLLNDRASVSLEIGKLKAEDGLDIRDREREEAIFEYLSHENKGPLKTFEMNQIFEKIISISRRLQSMETFNRADSESATPTLPSSFKGEGSGVGAELLHAKESCTIGGRTSVYGLLGTPVAQSMSPLMHNTAFALLGIDAVYLPFKVDNLPGALAGMRALHIKGASVTHPFKEQVIGLIDEIDDTANKIGAVNTLICEKNTIRGTNTDCVGAVRCIEALLPIKGHTFVVLGAGGAARAVVFGISSKGGTPVVVGRTEEKGRALAGEFDCAFVPLSQIDDIKGDCLVNTTPVGMYPKADETPVPRSVLGKYKAVADVIYNPLKTRLLREAEAAGCAVASGFEMFVYQGVEQFTIWTGRDAPAKEMREVVYHRLSGSGQ
ncbi:MAG: shikimate dehydrogenase [Desulfobacterales bacterium]|nr:shikimate dehydrogenase [Desulfobacterales bacterium]